MDSLSIIEDPPMTINKTVRYFPAILGKARVEVGLAPISIRLALPAGYAPRDA